jgi:hypothetical protein
MADKMNGMDVYSVYQGSVGSDSNVKAFGMTNITRGKKGSAIKK